ncbi:MAG TPA: COX15/CtaA family protein [Chitinophagaceae bacterium]|nr:COX15/CtaA family protein [Chitinophagaceae bacterium]
MNQLKEAGRLRPVAVWIMIGVGMLLIQVVLGGITRLTGSGLSITEWNVVTKLLPPLNGQQWMNEFDKYRQTSQYQYLNTHFTLSDFKFIFFWEWFHRLWAKLIAVAFLIPFVLFIFQKRISAKMIQPLTLLFLLGGLQGVIGWIMVKSGLTGDALYVKPTRLALHFVFALGLIAYAFWVGLRWMSPSPGIHHPKLKSLTVVIIVIVFLQLIFGALMAGHKAALVAPTWPTINGDMVPVDLFKERPLMLNLIDNTITIHFIHRSLASVIFILVSIWTVYAYTIQQTPSLFARTRYLPPLLIALQVLLGVLSVLQSPTIVPNHWGSFEWLALLHQVVGMIFLLSLVGMLYFLSLKYRTQQL